jgi:hypothetical protein
MMLALLGPLSSGTPGGPGRFFSYLFVLMGCYVLMRTWIVYSKRRRENAIPVLNPVGISLVSLFFIGLGFYGILH